MKKLLTLGFVSLSLITASAFAAEPMFTIPSAPPPPTTPAATDTPATTDTSTASSVQTGKHKKSGKKHARRKHKKHDSSDTPQTQ